ncbi:MAG: nicotinate-nucleotide adenylyltransferase [Acidimicrobiales bacterium]
MRIGVFGGTFDPIHIGHLVAATNAKYAAGLDLCYFVVANVPWQKENARVVTPADVRLGLVERAIAGLPGFAVSDLEIRRGGYSYTYDTLLELGESHPDDELYLIVGADAALEMTSWERASELSQLAELVIVSRPGFVAPTEILGWSSWVMVEIPSLAISSTDLRQRAIDGRPLDFLLPRFAIDYIKETNLYRDGGVNESS